MQPRSQVGDQPYDNIRSLVTNRMTTSVHSPTNRMTTSVQKMEGYNQLYDQLINLVATLVLLVQ